MGVGRVLGGIKRIKLKPYVKRIYRGSESGQMSFPKVRNKVLFDFSATVPRDIIDKPVAHLKKHSRKYEVASVLPLSYAGSAIAMRKRKKRGR